ncbi:hypothetical protein HZY97_12275 [Sphingomonas sp. R-74633]|uniref:colicin E3/pyocin S6 family cytotoxin n=1 Tax=Sphingomonas sp. R-74633 TaxID=2751188 RepID=UPI0015D13DC5|nr:hypothetical protein [Sphingomonas sp. R-74633]
MIPVPAGSFLEDCTPIGAPSGRKRWRSQNGKRLYEWDSLHGEIEVYNSRGEHIAVFDVDGNWKDEAVEGRRIDV